MATSLNMTGEAQNSNSKITQLQSQSSNSAPDISTSLPMNLPGKLGMLGKVNLPSPVFLIALNLFLLHFLVQLTHFYAF